MPAQTELTLSWHELVMASAVGTMRQISALKRGLENKHGCNNDSNWQVHIEGACGEMALAKYLRLFWDGSVNTFKMGADVGAFQVRTRSKPDYELILRDDDSPRQIYWLVTGTAPSYVIRGWIRGIDGMKPEWRKEHGGRPAAWFVPQNALKPPTQDPE